MLKLPNDNETIKKIQDTEEIDQLKSEIDTDNVIPGPVMSDNLLRQAVPDSVIKLVQYKTQHTINNILIFLSRLTCGVIPVCHP